MNTILTDDEIHKWWASENGMEDADMAKLNDFREVTRKVEAAVLAKLREQEPVAWMRKSNYGPFELHTGVGDPQETWPSNGHSWQPLYAAPQPAVVQVPVAWLVTGPYEKRAFTDLNFANACCRGLNKGFGEEAYKVTPLVPYAAPQPAELPVAWRAKDANGRWMYGNTPAPDLPGFQPELLALVVPQTQAQCTDERMCVGCYTGTDCKMDAEAPQPAVVQVPQGFVQVGTYVSDYGRGRVEWADNFKWSNGNPPLPEGHPIYAAAPEAPRASTLSRWTERWYGSGPDRGWSIWEMTTSTHGERVAYIGEGEHSERLTTTIVQKHNESLAAAPEAPATAVVRVPQECPACKGNGDYEKALSSTNYTWVKCADCGGTGKLAAPEAPATADEWLPLTPEEQNRLDELLKHTRWLMQSMPAMDGLQHSWALNARDAMQRMHDWLKVYLPPAMPSTTARARDKT